MSSLFPIQGLKQYPPLSNGNLTIDWSSPITMNLAAAFLPGMHLRDISGQVGDIVLFTAANHTFGNTLEGPALTSSAGGADNTLSLGHADLGSWTEATVYSRFQVGGGTTNNDFWGMITNTGGNCAMSIGGTGTARSYACYTATFSALANTTGALSVNAVHSVMITQSGTNYIVYADGKNITNGANAVAPTGRAANFQIAANCDTTTSLICLYVWLRKLSDAEGLWLEQNPYGFLIPSYNVWSIKALNSRSIWVSNPSSIMPDWV